MRYGEHGEGKDRVGEKSQAAEAIRMRGNQAQIDAQRPPEEARPDEQSKIPVRQPEFIGHGLQRIAVNFNGSLE